jgi:hypothetical protein
LGVSVEVDIPARNKLVGKSVEERREAKADYTAAVNRAFEAVERQLAKGFEALGQEGKEHESAGDTGMIVGLFPEQNYGFVELKGSPDLYFTRNAVVGNFDDLVVGMVVHVTRASGEGPMGPQASTVRLVGGAKSPS